MTCPKSSRESFAEWLSRTDDENRRSRNFIFGMAISFLVVLDVVAVVHSIYFWMHPGVCPTTVLVQPASNPSDGPVSARGVGGCMDCRDNVWVWQRPNNVAGFCAHWDVEHPDGDHSNITPEGERHHGTVIKEFFP
jgi:hypothetical protein